MKIIKNGFIVTLNEKDIAESVIKLFKGGISSKNCINFARSYDWNNIIEIIENVYLTTSLKVGEKCRRFLSIYKEVIKNATKK